MSLSTTTTLKLTNLKGVGEKLVEKLNKIGVFQPLDLLFHLPYRYQDRTRIAPIGGLRFGQAVVVEAEVRAAQVVFGKRRSLVVRVQDGTGTLTLRFFHFSAAQKNQFVSGNRVRCYGEVRTGSTGYEMYHPEYKLLNAATASPLENCLTPLYPTTEGLNQTRIRLLVDQVLPHVRQLPDYVPEVLLQKFQLPTLAQAVQELHHPSTDTRLDLFEQGQHPAQRRLALEELLAHNLSLKQLKQQAQLEPAVAMPLHGHHVEALKARLPFQLTAAQQRVFTELSADMCRRVPMMRLVQGDVGSGKTMVAVLAALQAVENGFQCALMVPTEILAEQHFNNICQLVNPLGLGVAWLVGKHNKKIREQQLAEVAEGRATIVVGTHALFQESVRFHRLGLIIIDEQHRFGVHQRLALREKGQSSGQIPHQLIMTATPIPRTLTMSAYADLDCSIIDELPPGRKPVVTTTISDQRRVDVIARVASACQSGRQVYWVCTLIEESEELQCQAAEDTAADLALALPQLRIGLVHGRMKATQKAEVMEHFKKGDLHLLVATTVIEVGVDVPNASVMIIENPERLGLAQLHQLRGRVGRGDQESFCVLVYGSSLSQQGKERLQVMKETNDGFKIAEKDLELRGPGEVLGTRQTGLMQFKVADLQRDAGMLDDVQWLAEQLLTYYPENVEPVIKRWIPDGEKYGKV
ncbi:ATP-dependent DNA helicase RecG [Gynuella sp.]|uniref:ATP-dependent DNA helicase RecG n=1 Tax=Gynuella sp. TaxID=2969146 RepID=UPI003D0B56E5